MGQEGSSSSQVFVPTIKAIGVGGGGGNVVAHMTREGVTGVELIAANTDSQALQATGAPARILLGQATTGGRGAGSHAEVGRACADESRQAIGRALQGADMVFIAAGLGGGTGSGASPVVAELAKHAGALAVAVITLPFSFEGRRRAATAEASLEALLHSADIVLVLPNDRLVDVTPKDMTLLRAFALVDNVLTDVIRGISSLATEAGLINVDFADVRTVMENRGRGVIGMGTASGEGRMLKALHGAIRNPLMGEVDIGGARGILVHFIGNEQMGLLEIDEAMQEINRQAGDGANLIFGASTRPRMGDSVSVLMIVTGIDGAG